MVPPSLSMRADARVIFNSKFFAAYQRLPCADPNLRSWTDRGSHWHLL